MYCILPCTWIGWLTSRKRALYPFAVFISIFKNHFFYILNKTSAGFGFCLSINFWKSCCDFSQQKILWVPTCILFVERIHPITQLTHQVKVCITAIGKDFSFKMVNMPQQQGLLSSSASSELVFSSAASPVAWWLLRLAPRQPALESPGGIKRRFPGSGPASTPQQQNQQGWGRSLFKKNFSERHIDLRWVHC